MLMATLELEIEDLSVLPALQDVLSRFKCVALKSIKEKSLEELRVSKKSTDLEEYLKRVKEMDDDGRWKELETLSESLPDCPMSEKEIVTEVKKNRMEK